ncbi:MAG: hypothetical protein O6939_04695 [Bacteroidetes bacterium]|nr:hypothetical protein [Bacteroidota bacterium]
MQIFWSLAYNVLIVPVLYLGFYLGSVFDPKIKQGRKGRSGQFQRMKKWNADQNSDKVRILFHCTSVGEWLQAVPVIEKLKSHNSELLIIVSFFSSSGFDYVKGHPLIDLKVYLPLDTAVQARKFFHILKPHLWIISKFDVWPNHLWAASGLNIPTIMIAATLSSTSRRYKGINRWFGPQVYKHFQYIFPIADDDSQRFMHLFPYPDKLLVAGDTRFDSVFSKGEKVKIERPINLFKDNNGLTLIAGSIWPSDEKYLLPALIELLQEHPYLKVVLVPHELKESHLTDIEKKIKNAGWEIMRYTQLGANKASIQRVILMDTIGMLAGLYRSADLAYVGGSFSTGVHNVMEPAIFSNPVLFGPNHRNSLEAIHLVQLEAAFEVRNKEEMISRFELLITNSDIRRLAGHKAEQYIHDHLGATDQIFKVLKESYDFISQHYTN